MNRYNPPFERGWGEGPPGMRGPLRGSSSEFGSSQGMMNNPVAPPPPSWNSISRSEPNNWEDEQPRAGMSNQFSGHSGGFANSLRKDMDEMQEKINRLQARGFSDPRSEFPNQLGMGARSGPSQMNMMGMGSRDMGVMGMGSRDMGVRSEHSLMESMDIRTMPGHMSQPARRTPSPPRHNMWNKDEQNFMESARLHPRNMREAEALRNRQYEPEQSQDIMDEVDVIWESARGRRQGGRIDKPLTPSPPRHISRSPVRPSPHRRPASPPPPRLSQRSPSPPQLPDKVYSCICRIVLFEESCQAGVVELEGSNGQKAYCFFLAKHVVSRSISKLSSQLRVGSSMKVNARLVSALARLPYLASTLWSEGGTNLLGNIYFDPDEEDLIKYQQLAGHLSRQLDTQLSSGRLPQVMGRTSRERDPDSRPRPMEVMHDNRSRDQQMSHSNPHSLPPPVAIGRAPVLPKPAPAIPRREEERRQADTGYQRGDVWKAIKQGSQRNPPKSIPPPLTQAQIEDQRRLAEAFKRQEEKELQERREKNKREERARESERDKRKMERIKLDEERANQRKEKEKNKSRRFVENLDDTVVEKGIGKIQKEIQDLEARIIPAANKLGITGAVPVDKFGCYAVRPELTKSKRSSPEVIEISDNTKSASEVYSSMFLSNKDNHRERSNRRDKSPEREKRNRDRSRSRSPAHKRRATSPHRHSTKSPARDHRSKSPHRRRHRSRSKSPRRRRHRTASRSPHRSRHRRSRSREHPALSKSPLRFGEKSTSPSPRSRRSSDHYQHDKRSSRSKSRNRSRSRDRGGSKLPVPAFIQQSSWRKEHYKEDALKIMLEKVKGMNDAEKNVVDRVYVMIEAEMLFDGQFRQLTQIGASASASKRQLSFFRAILPTYIDEYMSNLVTSSERSLLNTLGYKFDEGTKTYHFTHIKKGDIIPHKECDALEDLMSFLRSVSENKKDIVLFTYSSDVLLPILLAKIDHYGLSQDFNELVKGFCDLSSCIKNLNLSEIWKNTNDLSDIYKNVMCRSWPRENRHCDGISVLCGTIVKRMIKDYEDYLSTQKLQFGHTKFLDVCGRKTVAEFREAKKYELEKVVCTEDLKRAEISVVEFWPSEMPSKIEFVPLKRCDIIEIDDLDDVDEEGIDDEDHFDLEALEATVVNETTIKPSHFATVSLVILSTKTTSSSPIFEGNLDGHYVLVSKNNYFKKSQSEKCQISRQIVKVLRTLRPCADSDNMCEAVYVVQVKVLNRADKEICLEKGDAIAVYRKEKGESVPRPKTPPPPPVKEKKKKKKAKKAETVDYDALDFDALDFEPSDTDEESTDEEEECSKDECNEELKEKSGVEENQVTVQSASYPTEAELFVTMNVKQLKDELSKVGLNIYGLKKDLVGRLYQYKKEIALNPHKANLKKMTANKIAALRNAEKWEEELPGLRMEAFEVVHDIVEDIFDNATRHPIQELIDEIIEDVTIKSNGPKEVPPTCTEIDSDEDIIEDCDTTKLKFHEKLYKPFLTETLNIMPKKKAKVRINLTKLDVFAPELQGRKVLVRQNLEESETCHVEDQICVVKMVQDSRYDYDKATIDVIVTNPYSDEIYVDGSEERRIILFQLEKLEKEELNGFEIPEDEDIGHKRIDELFDETIYNATTTSDIEMGPRSYHLEKCSITLKGKDIDLTSDKLILIKKAKKGAMQIGTRKLILVPQQLKVLECQDATSAVYFVEIKLFNASKQGFRISKRTLIGDVRMEKENIFSEQKKLTNALDVPFLVKPFSSRIIKCQIKDARNCKEGQLAVINKNVLKASHLVIKEGLAVVELRGGTACVPIIVSNGEDKEINVCEEYDCYTKIRLEMMEEEASEEQEPPPPGEELDEVSEETEPPPPGEETTEKGESADVDLITLD